MSDDRVLDYLMSMNGEREGAGRRVFEIELTRTPALWQELEEQRSLGQARQLKYNEPARTKRGNASL